MRIALFLGTLAVVVGAVAGAAHKALPSTDAPRSNRQGGGVRTMPGESQMIYSVVQKQASGALVEFHVIGLEQATTMVNSSATTQHGGGRNDR